MSVNHTSESDTWAIAQFGLNPPDRADDTNIQLEDILYDVVSTFTQGDILCEDVSPYLVNHLA